MEITIKCDSLKELHDTLEQLVVLLPEKPTGKKNAEEKTKNGRQVYNRDAIRAFVKSGQSYTQAARHFGCSYATVANICRGGET